MQEVFMQRSFFVRLAMVAMVMSGLSSAARAAEPEERALDAERRALEAERRAVAAERRALESERRALEADRNASEGASEAPANVQPQPQACQTATTDYMAICSYPSRDAIGDTPECAAAQAEMRRRCGG
jgi:uncharacterized protein YlxW (UPF0749 family)